MQLSKKAIEEFKRIYLKRYGVSLTESQANDLGVRILHFYRFKYKK